MTGFKTIYAIIMPEQLIAVDKAKRNIVLPILFHISAGYFNEIFATHPMSKVIQTALLALFALYIILNDKEFSSQKVYKLLSKHTTRF